MTNTSILEKLYDHAFDMVKFGETKNTVLIAFNLAFIAGLTRLAFSFFNWYIFLYLMFAIAMCAISLFIAASALVARTKNTPPEQPLPVSDKPLFFATVANMTQEQLLDKLNNQYHSSAENPQYESDLARQAIITSQIASKKFKLFNTAIAFTFGGVATPVGLLIYRLFFYTKK